MTPEVKTKIERALNCPLELIETVLRDYGYQIVLEPCTRCRGTGDSVPDFVKLRDKCPQCNGRGSNVNPEWQKLGPECNLHFVAAHIPHPPEKGVPIFYKRG